MMGKRFAELSEGDIRFLVGTVDPRLLSRIETIKGDPEIIEGMLEQESDRLFQRMMLMTGAGFFTNISPRLFFEVLLRRALREMESQSYTVERDARQRIPVFDAPQVVRFLGNKTVLKYLADMLSSFTRVNSFTVPTRVRKGIWRKVRFSDMDVDSLIRFCNAVDEEHRFSYYKRIADLCLFILGMFPEHAAPGFPSLRESRSRPPLARRRRKSAEEYEAVGRRFYRLAREHREAQILELVDVFESLHTEFVLAKKPLNHISERFLRLHKGKLFPSPS